jgi:hypothetical protein
MSNSVRSGHAVSICEAVARRRCGFCATMTGSKTLAGFQNRDSPLLKKESPGTFGRRRLTVSIPLGACGRRRALLGRTGKTGLHSKCRNADPHRKNYSLQHSRTSSINMMRAWEAWRQTGNEPRVLRRTRSIEREPAGLPPNLLASGEFKFKGP